MKVLITGASRGIGLEMVRYGMDHGWDVLACCRHPQLAENLLSMAQLSNGRVRVFLADMSELATLQALAYELRHAAIDMLINNAGVSPKTPYKERLGCLNGDISAWRDVFELNFFTPLTLARGFASALHRGKGAICNITSIAGHYVHPFAGSAYSTSKAALSGLTREMAVEFAELGVRVNAVAPGEIKTDMISPEYEALVPRIPMNRMGTPEDVAAAVHYLVGDDSSYVTGTEIFVTGGQHLY